MIKRIGRYEVHAELGRGGFGQVFRAYDPGVGRPVAIKTLTLTGDPEMLTRFRNEAGATGKLRHPNIIVVYDFGEQDGTPYIVMELLEGEDLDRCLASGRRLTLLESVYVMTQVAAGLNHAHLNGIAHRDVKPANIMMLPNGTVKIMDFGIALLMQATAARITPKGSLIGTFPYMAPEQFYGTASDELTDIFAYGVTFYKVLTGTHPFEASEMAGVMFNIVNKTPQSIRELNPECSEPLEQVVFKAMAKDRESRYQSLEDVLFDLEPIVVELRKERTGELIAEAHQRIAAEQFDEAQSVIKQALEIDPANRTARELRERLQSEIKKRNLRPRIAALLDQGREQLRARQYNEAIQKFESALRLDQSSPEIQALIEEARGAWDRAQRSERLVTEGHRAFESGDLTAAHKSITDALSISPDDQGARELLQNIGSQIEDRNRQQRLAEFLSQARGLILLQNFDEAIKMLGSLQAEYVESGELRELLARATQEREAQARQQRLQAGVREVKDLLKERNFSAALGKLSTLAKEFPESAELRELGSYAREELKAQQQVAAIAAVTSEVKDMLTAGRLDAAVERLRGALGEHPGASALRELLQSTLSAKAEHERSTALEAAAQEARRLLGGGRFSEALTAISSFTNAYGEAAVLDSLRRAAEGGLEKQRRILAIRSLLLEAQGLIDQGRPATAKEVLEQATIEYPGDPNVSRLFGVAENKLREQQQAEAVSKLIDESETQARSGQFDSALQALATGLRQFAGNTRLLRCQEAILAQRARHERERLRTEALERVTQLRAQGNLKEAARALQQAIESFGEDQETVALSQDFAAAAATLARQREIEGAVRQGQALMDDGNPSLAVQYLREAVSKHPEADNLKTVLALAEERCAEQQSKDVAAILADARQHLENERFAEALQLLDTGLAKHPGRKELGELHEQVLAAQEARARQTALASACDEIAEARRAGRFEDALKAVLGALERFGEEPVLIELRTQLEHDLEAVGRAERLQSARREIQSLLAQGEPRAAANLVQLARAEYGDEPELASLLAAANRALEKQRQEAEIRQAAEQAQALADQLQFEEAYAVLDGALTSYPDEKTLLSLRDSLRNRQALLDLLARARQIYASGDLQQALETVELGLKHVPQDRDWLGLKGQITRDLQNRLRAEAMRKAIEAAEESLRDGRYQAGVTVLDEAAGRYGAWYEAVSLRTRLTERIEEKRRAEARRRNLEELSAIRQELESEKRKRRLKALNRQAGSFAALYPQDEEFSQLAREINNRIQSLKPAPRPFPWKLISAAAALLAATSAVLVFQPFHRRPAVLIATQIRTDPEGAAVSFGDRSCVTPNCTFRLPPGEYRIRTSLPGYREVQQTVTIETGKLPRVIDLTLDPAPPPPAGPGTGTIVVSTGVPKALVTIDGVPRGRTDQQGSLAVALEAAVHDVQVKKAGYDTPPARQIRVVQGSSESVSLTMTLQIARLELRGAPAGTNIRINDALIGTASGLEVFSASVKPGEQIIEIAQGSAKRQLAENLEPGQTLALDWKNVAPAPASQPVTAPPVAAPPPEVIERQEWERVRASSNPNDLAAFLGRHPTSLYAPDAKARLDDLNWARSDSNDKRALLGYRTQFPNGRHFQEARDRIAELDWGEVNREDAPSLKSFIDSYPDSRHRSEAQLLLDRLEQRKLEATRKTEPQNTVPEKPRQPSAQAPSPPRQDLETQSIRAALEQFNGAFSNKQSRDLKRVWPAAPSQYTKAMQLPGTTYLMTLRPIADVQVANDTASVLCELTTRMTVRGQPTGQQKSVVVLLRKNGDAWVIVDPFGAAK